MSKMSSREDLSVSSSRPRLRRRVRRVSSRSSRDSDDSERLGVDLLEEGFVIDLVLRSWRLDAPDETEDCWDCGLLARALEDRRGEGGAIERTRMGERGRGRLEEGD